MVDNDGDAVEDITLQFRFRTETRNPNTFLYNTGQITSLDDADWNVRQFYTVSRIDGPRRSGRARVLAENVPSPPVNVGVRSIPDYASLAAAAVRPLSNGDPGLRRPARRRVLREPWRLRPARRAAGRQRYARLHRRPQRP